MLTQKKGVDENCVDFSLSVISDIMILAGEEERPPKRKHMPADGNRVGHSFKMETM